MLIIVHGHPATSTGGAEIAAYQLFKALAGSRDVSPSFLAVTRRTGQPSRASLPLKASGRPGEYLLEISGFNYYEFLQDSPLDAERLLSFILEMRPDVLHLHHYLNVGLNVLSEVRRRLPSVRIFITLHEYLAICHHYGLMVTTIGDELCDAGGPDRCSRCFPEHEPEEFARRRLSILSHFARVDRFIAPSEFLRRRYIEWGLPAWQIAILPNSVESLPAVSPPDPPRPRTRFGYFGQIHPYKGLAPLLAAFDRLGRASGGSARSATLQVHGANLDLNEPAYKAKVEALRARNADRVDILGHYPREALPALMAGVDWVVTPSIWWENSPLVIEEALAHRRPVVCSDLGGMKEKVRPGLDGFHFPAGDVDALGALISHLAGNEDIWRALQSTMRRPTTAADSAAAHLALYRDESFSFAS